MFPSRCTEISIKMNKGKTGMMTERSGEGEQRGEDKEKVGKIAKGVWQLGL